jgi:leader peptidase (prepilin peptidase)/N-methyltransferase
MPVGPAVGATSTISSSPDDSVQLVDDAWIRALVALPFGLVAGSFMTVAAHRMPRGESVVRPRSRCPSCGAEIGARDNVPVLSWLLLRGRCRRCGQRISASYPLLELVTALLVILVAIRYPNPWQIALVAGLLALMPGIAVIDLQHRIIPNRLTYPALLVFPPVILLAWLIDDAADPARAGIGLLAYGGILFLVAVVSRGMGMGDVKLAALIGLVLGSLGLRFVAVAAGAAIVFGGLGGVIALAMGRGRKSQIPFGPYLAAGAAIGGLWGEPIASWYIRNLL